MMKRTTKRSTHIAPLLGLALGLGLAGCETGGWGFFSANGSSSDEENPGMESPRIYVAQVNLAPFYRYGPAQASAPDWHVKRGEEVEMLQVSKGYSRARLASGMVGWVNTDDFEPKQGEMLSDGPGSLKRPAGRVSGEEEFVPPSDPAREMPMPEPVSPPPGLPEFRI